MIVGHGYRAPVTGLEKWEVVLATVISPVLETFTPMMDEVSCCWGSPQRRG